MPAIVVAGDVGGTKTHLGLYQLADGKLTQLRDRTYVTHDFPNLEATLADFLAGAGKVNAACFGVPGPVIDSVSHATNVHWDMREQSIAASIGGAATRLVNDLEATGYGLLHLEDSQLAVLQQGETFRTSGNIAVIAAGTGLGESALIATGGTGMRLPRRVGIRTLPRAAESRLNCSIFSRANSITSVSSGCCRVRDCGISIIS